MKLLKNITSLLVIFFLVTSCEKEEKPVNLDYISAPSNVSASINIAEDNTGTVSIIPSAEGVVSYSILFGDVENETPTAYSPGEEITHVYNEGSFQITLSAIGITGLSSDYTEEITVTFLPPENLVVEIEEDNIMPNEIHLTASADLSTFIEVYFGDQSNEEPAIIESGGSISHIYNELGDFEVNVIAKNGGSGTISYTEIVSITTLVEPLYLPIDFESETIVYSFTDFGNMATSVVDNPDASGINTSTKVAQSTKNAGAETWAGTFLELDEIIDFSVGTTFKVKVWSPNANTAFLLKLENSDASIVYEVSTSNTTANTWEELSYDFSGMPSADYIKVVIFCDFGNVGDGTSYYFDDIELTN